MTEPSHALEVEIAKLQLLVQSMQSRMERLESGDQESRNSGKAQDIRMAVIETNVQTITAMLAEMRGDVKALLTFRALLFGGAAVVSVIMSIVVNIIARWLGKI